MAVLLAVAVLLPTLGYVQEGCRLKSPEQAALGRYLRESVPAEATLFAFEPAWGIAGGACRASCRARRWWWTPTALMLRGGLASGQHFAQTAEAFQTPGSQQTIREVLAHSRFVVLGWRGQWQLDEESKQWFRSRFAGASLRRARRGWISGSSPSRSGPAA